MPLPQWIVGVAVQNVSERVCMGIWLLYTMNDPYTASPEVNTEIQLSEYSCSGVYSSGVSSSIHQNAHTKS